MKFSVEKNLEINNLALTNSENNLSLTADFKSLINKISNEILFDFNLDRVKDKLAVLSIKQVKENKLKVNPEYLADFILQSALETTYQKNGGFLKENLEKEYFSLLFNNLKNKILSNNPQASFQEWSNEFRSDLKMLASELPQRIGLPASTIGEEARRYLTTQEKSN